MPWHSNETWERSSSLFFILSIFFNHHLQSSYDLNHSLRGESEHGTKQRTTCNLYGCVAFVRPSRVPDRDRHSPERKKPSACDTQRRVVQRDERGKKHQALGVSAGHSAVGRRLPHAACLPMISRRSLQPFEPFAVHMRFKRVFEEMIQDCLEDIQKQKQHPDSSSGEDGAEEDPSEKQCGSVQRHPSHHLFIYFFRPQKNPTRADATATAAEIFHHLRRVCPCTVSTTSQMVSISSRSTITVDFIFESFECL